MDILSRNNIVSNCIRILHVTIINRALLMASMWSWLKTVRIPLFKQTLRSIDFAFSGSVISAQGGGLVPCAPIQVSACVTTTYEYCGNVLYDNVRSSEGRPCLHEVCRVATDEDKVSGNLDKVFVDGGYATLNATTGLPYI